MSVGSIGMVLLASSVLGLVGAQAPSTLQAPTARYETSSGCESGSCELRASNAVFSGSDQAGHPLLSNVNVFSADGKDPRRYVQRRGEYAPIGRVLATTKGGGDLRSTGFLISPCFVVTTHHSVTNTDGTLTNPITFSAGEGPHEGYKHLNVEAELFATGGGRDPKNLSRDWVILRLKNCIGGDPEIGWMENGIGGLANYDEFRIAGFSADRDPNRLSAQQGCQARGSARSHGATGEFVKAVYHDCGQRPGGSGSPLYIISDGRPVAVGLSISGFGEQPGVLRTYDDNHASIAGYASGISSDTNDSVVLDIEAYGKPNPQIQIQIQILRDQAVAEAAAATKAAADAQAAEARAAARPRRPAQPVRTRPVVERQ